MSTHQKHVKANYGDGLYTIKTVAGMLDRSVITIRRWMTVEGCPLPSHKVTTGDFEMNLWDDDDVSALRRWSEGIRPGPKSKTATAQRRVPGQPFDKKANGQSATTVRLTGTDAAPKRPRGERPAEKWARLKGGKVVEKKMGTGKNVVTVLAVEREGPSPKGEVKKKKS